MLFDGWDSLIRTLVVGVLAYIALVVFLRVLGKRTLSKMNAFDLVVTVALGSTLATALVQARVTEDEVRAAVRSAGVDTLDRVRAVVLETDGSFSVVQGGDDGKDSSLVGVNRPKKFRNPGSEP